MPKAERQPCCETRRVLDVPSGSTTRRETHTEALTDPSESSSVSLGCHPQAILADRPDQELFADGHDEAVASGHTVASEVEQSYWAVSRSPLASMVFILPLVLTYEAGVLLFGRGAPRNGADIWLRGILDSLGFGAYFFLLPVLTVIGLAAWHHLEHDRWQFSARVLAGMVFESLALACVLVGLAQLQEGLWRDIMPLLRTSAGLETGVFDSLPFSKTLQRLVGFCGAGLYEEVLFRLLMLPSIAWGLARLGVSSSAALAGGVVLSSLLFSAAHYVGLHGETFQLYSFTFRTVAGFFFGLLFLLRGFGISAGTHAAYDVLVGLF
jgi:hypothetical protein